jgi:hypothetical protein
MVFTGAAISVLNPHGFGPASDLTGSAGGIQKISPVLLHSMLRRSERASPVRPQRPVVPRLLLHGLHIRCFETRGQIRFPVTVSGIGPAMSAPGHCDTLQL